MTLHDASKVLLRWFVAIVILGTMVCIHLHGQTFVTTGCEYLNMVGTNLYRQSLQNCKNSCSTRPWCKAVNYFRKEQKCSLLRTDNGTDLAFSNHSCVHISRDVIENTKRHDCEKKGMCNKIKNRNNEAECHPFGNLPNAETLGNMHLEGSHLRIKCNNNSRETTGRDRTACTSTGNWSHYPQCIIELTPTLGKQCVDSSDCVETESVCIERKCFCSSLYRYNTSQMNCVKVCTELTNEFTEHQGFGILFYDYGHHYNTGSLECQRLCREDLNCLSYVYTFLYKECRLLDVSMDMITDADPNVLSSETSIVWSRRCA